MNRGIGQYRRDEGKFQDRTQVYGNSYHVSAVRLWNSLHRNLRDSQSLGAFKTSLMKYLKGSQ
jgi:hypothetical protein